MKAKLFLFLLFFLPTSLLAQPETINWLTGVSGTASGGFALIPNEQRTFFIAQTNYTTIGANFTVAGGTVVSSLNGAVTIQAPASGSACTFDSKNRVVASATNVAITATPKDNGASAVTLTVPVCNPTPVHHNLPTFRLGVYKSQPVTLQCIVEGTTNKACSWSITTNPGSAGSLSDDNQRDTVFTATAPGRYVITSTADADSSPATTIIDVPDNSAMPYPVTANGTEPVNCATDTNLTGNVYHVGPGQTYSDLTALTSTVTPAAGDTILVSNQSSGANPTTLYNYLVLQSLGTQEQPIFVCGVPNAAGSLPAIDGTNATSTFPSNQYYSGYGLINFYNGAYSSTEAYPRFIQLSGFALQNANNTQVYQATANGHTTTNTWGTLPAAGNLSNALCTLVNVNCPTFAAAVRVQNGGDINIIGNEMKYVGLAVFTEAKAPLSEMSWRVLVEGNYIHDFGYSTAASTAVTGGTHALYMQSYEEVIQGNHFGPAASTHQGGVLKDRGVVQFIRYNYLDNADTSTRNIDLVDQQDGCYTNAMQFIACAGSSAANITPDAGFSWDAMAGWNEAFNNETWVYGNIQVSKVLGPVHYNGDHGQYTNAPRLGHLHYYNNTLLCPSGCTAFDPSAPNTPLYAFPTIDVQNSIFWVEGATTTSSAGLSFLRGRQGILNAVSLVTPAGAITNDQMSTNIWTPWTGWPGMDTTLKTAYYADYNNLPAHISGFGTSNSAVPGSVSSRPYDTTTLSSAIAGTVLPSGYLPVRFQFRPDLGYVTARQTTVSSSVAGVVGAVDGGSNGTGSNGTSSGQTTSSQSSPSQTSKTGSDGTGSGGGLPVTLQRPSVTTRRYRH